MSGELSLLVVHPLNSRTSGRNSFNRIESLVRDSSSTCNFGIRILVSTSTEFSRIGFSCPQRQPSSPNPNRNTDKTICYVIIECRKAEKEAEKKNAVEKSRKRS